MIKKKQHFIGYSQASLDAAIANAREKASQQQALNVSETLSSLIEGMANQYQVILVSAE